MRTIPSAELEQAMLVLPFSDAIDMLRVSHHLLCRGVAVELCSKVALFLLRVHQRQVCIAAPHLSDSSLLPAVLCMVYALRLLPLVHCNPS